MYGYQGFQYFSRLPVNFTIYRWYFLLRFEQFSWISYTTLFKIRRYQAGKKYLILPLIERPELLKNGFVIIDDPAGISCPPQPLSSWPYPLWNITFRPYFAVSSKNTALFIIVYTYNTTFLWYTGTLFTLCYNNPYFVTVMFHFSHFTFIHILIIKLRKPYWNIFKPVLRCHLWDK